MSISGVVSTYLSDICYYPCLFLGQLYQVFILNNPYISFFVVKCILIKCYEFYGFFICQRKCIAFGIYKQHLIKQAGVIHFRRCFSIVLEKNFSFYELRKMIYITWCKDILNFIACFNSNKC